MRIAVIFIYNYFVNDRKKPFFDEDQNCMELKSLNAHRLWVIACRLWINLYIYAFQEISFYVLRSLTVKLK